MVPQAVKFGRAVVPRGATQPVAGLQKQVAALEAAMLVAVSGAEVGAVHRLRTATRRVEAQLALLEALTGGDLPMVLPAHAREAAAVHRRLRKIRRAAATVRDLDVQRDSIWYDAPKKAAVHDGSPGDTMRRQAKALRKHLESQREGEATRLVTLLKKEQAQLAASLRALEAVLQPAAAASVSAAVFAQRISHVFTHAALPPLHARKLADGTDAERERALLLAIEHLKEEQLHTVRKAAKLCRYMAESTAQRTVPNRMAERFEALQESGGAWHDWLLLSQLSEKFHGKQTLLTQRYAKHAAAALAEYQLKLAKSLPAFLGAGK